MPDDLEDYLKSINFTASTTFDIEYIGSPNGIPEDNFDIRCKNLQDFVLKKQRKYEIVQMIEIWSKITEKLVWEFDCVVRFYNLSPAQDTMQLNETLFIDKSINIVIYSHYRSSMEKRILNIAIENRPYLRAIKRFNLSASDNVKDQQQVNINQRNSEPFWSKQPRGSFDPNSSISNDISSFLRKTKDEKPPRSSNYPQNTKPFGLINEAAYSSPPSLANHAGSVHHDLRDMDITRAGSINEELLTFALEEMKPSLTSITSNLEIIKEEFKEHSDSFVTKLLRTTMSSVVLIQNLVCEVMDYQQLSLGIFRLIPENFDLKQVVGDCFDIVKIAADAKNTSLDMDFEEKPHFIRSDKQRIKQIILNFLNHSIKTCNDRGDRYIRVYCREKEKTFYFCFEDTGEGINKEIVNQINLKNYPSSQVGFYEGISFYLCKQILNKLGPMDTMKIQVEPKLSNKISFEIYKNSDQATKTTMASPSTMTMEKQSFDTKDKTKRFKSQSILKLNEDEALKSKQAIEEKRKNKNNYYSQNEIQSISSHAMIYKPVALSDIDSSSNASFMFLQKGAIEDSLPKQPEQVGNLNILILCKEGLEVEVVTALVKKASYLAGLQVSIQVSKELNEYRDLSTTKTFDILILDKVHYQSSQDFSKLDCTYRKEKPLLILWTGDTKETIAKFESIDQFTDPNSFAKMLLRCRESLI